MKSTIAIIHAFFHQTVRFRGGQILLIELLLCGVSGDVLAQTIVAPAPANSLPTWVTSRQEHQVETSSQFSTLHDFRLSDRLPASGITFVHRAVADANKHYKAVHYDHGNGVAVADVDGDGRLDIYFLTQLGANELWRNLGGGRFENITERAGVGLGDRISVAASFGDIDNDGDPDLYVTTVRFGNALFENLGQGRFRDITREAGLDYSGHSSGAVFFDIDKDGRLDLFLCNVGRYTTETLGEGGYYVGFSDGFKGHLKPGFEEPSILYRNLGERRFQDVSKDWQLQDLGWTGDATVVDLNEDGWPDLYTVNMQGDDHYHENVAGRRFTEKTAAYFPKTPWGAMGVKFFDFNRDGLMDLFLTDMHSDMTDKQTQISRDSASPLFERAKSERWCTTEWSDAYLQGASNNIFGNAFYLNQGKGKFLEVSDKIGAETFWPWGLSTGDLNADGYEDVFITAGMGFGFRYALNSVLLNHQGQRFFDAEFLVGVEPRRDRRTDQVGFTLDCSGADKDHPLCQGQSGRVPIRETLSSRSSVIFDLDEDGDLDLVTNDMNSEPQVFLSDLTERRTIQYLKVRLAGSASNRDAIGATVRLHTGDQVQTRYHDGKSGYMSQSSLPLYFGLGDLKHIDRLEILWPSGQRQVVAEGLKPNTTVTIEEPKQ